MIELMLRVCFVIHDASNLRANRVTRCGAPAIRWRRCKNAGVLHSKGCKTHKDREKTGVVTEAGGLKKSELFRSLEYCISQSLDLFNTRVVFITKLGLQRLRTLFDRCLEKGGRARQGFDMEGHKLGDDSLGNTILMKDAGILRGARVVPLQTWRQFRGLYNSVVGRCG